jgi:hypothetical protein
VEVKILDLVVYPCNRQILESLIKDFKPQMIGITAVTMTFDNAIRVIRDVKRIDPDMLTVMGGPHVTFCAQDTLEDYPELDVIVMGEGEKTVVELAQAAVLLFAKVLKSVTRRMENLCRIWTVSRRRPGICWPWADTGHWECQSV